jgi:hypothetical protein
MSKKKEFKVGDWCTFLYKSKRREGYVIHDLGGCDPQGRLRVLPLGFKNFIHIKASELHHTKNELIASL